MGDRSSPFDQIRHEDGGGEWWSARELMVLMDYAQWRDFALVIEKAKSSLILIQGEHAGQGNFAEMRKYSEGPGRPGVDYRLSRFAAYLVAMAGDASKKPIAEARIYFAVRTREAEVAATSASISTNNQRK